MTNTLIKSDQLSKWSPSLWRKTTINFPVLFNGEKGHLRWPTTITLIPQLEYQARHLKANECCCLRYNCHYGKATKFFCYRSMFWPYPKSAFNFTFIEKIHMSAEIASGLRQSRPRHSNFFALIYNIL